MLFLAPVFHLIASLIGSGCVCISAILVQNFASDKDSFALGVPQGSISGPVLFRVVYSCIHLDNDL